MRTSAVAVAQFLAGAAGVGLVDTAATLPTAPTLRQILGVIGTGAVTVATEVTNAALQVESNLRRMQASRAARELSEKRLENEQSKFEVGMSTNFFVVQAQRDLLDAQIAELRSALDYQKALVAFERVQKTAGGI